MELDVGSCDLVFMESLNIQEFKVFVDFWMQNGLVAKYSEASSGAALAEGLRSGSSVPQTACARRRGRT